MGSDFRMPPYRDFRGCVPWITIVGGRVSAISLGSGDVCLRGGLATCAWGVTSMCVVAVGTCCLARQSAVRLVAVRVGRILIGRKRVVGLWAVFSQICIWIVCVDGYVSGAPIPFGLDGLFLGYAASCKSPRCLLLGDDFPPMSPVHAVNVRADSWSVGVDGGIDGSCSSQEGGPS